MHKYLTHTQTGITSGTGLHNWIPPRSIQHRRHTDVSNRKRGDHHKLHNPITRPLHDVRPTNPAHTSRASIGFGKWCGTYWWGYCVCGIGSGDADAVGVHHALDHGVGRLGEY